MTNPVLGWEPFGVPASSAAFPPLRSAITLSRSTNTLTTATTIFGFATPVGPTLALSPEVSTLTWDWIIDGLTGIEDVDFYPTRNSTTFLHKKLSSYTHNNANQPAPRASSAGAIVQETGDIYLWGGIGYQATTPDSDSSKANEDVNSEPNVAGVWSTSEFGDVWKLAEGDWSDPTSWSLHHSFSKSDVASNLEPLPRGESTSGLGRVTKDSTHESLIIFGGITIDDSSTGQGGGVARPMNDVWAIDLNTGSPSWEKLWPLTSSSSSSSSSSR